MGPSLTVFDFAKSENVTVAAIGSPAGGTIDMPGFDNNVPAEPWRAFSLRSALAYWTTRLLPLQFLPSSWVLRLVAASEHHVCRRNARNSSSPRSE
jgi:hypothetical protein